MHALSSVRTYHLPSSRATPNALGQKAKKYTKEHEMVSYDSDSGIGTMSISDYAQESLGQVAFVELPNVGLEVKQEGPYLL